MSQKRPAAGGEFCRQAFVGTRGQNEKTYNVRADYRFHHNINTQLLSLPLLFPSWHSLPFLWNDQGFFMCIKR